MFIHICIDSETVFKYVYIEYRRDSYIYTYVCTHMYMYVQIYIHRLRCCIQMNIYISIYVYIYICTHIYIYDINLNTLQVLMENSIDSVQIYK